MLHRSANHEEGDQAGLISESHAEVSRSSKHHTCGSVFDKPYLARGPDWHCQRSTQVSLLQQLEMELCPLAKLRGAHLKIGV